MRASEVGYSPDPEKSGWSVGSLGDEVETFEHFVGFWPSATGTYADVVNPLPKYVASRTLTGEQPWNARLLGEDTVGAVREFKEQVDGTLISYGCGELAATLAYAGLVDEVRMWVHPVVWGHGARPFHAGELPLRMRLVTASPYPTGVVRLSYQPI